MNPKVKEPYYSLMWKASIGWNNHLFEVPTELIEQFGELIVKECINKLATRFSNTGTTVEDSRSFQHMVDLIEHFNIKQGEE